MDNKTARLLINRLDILIALLHKDKELDLVEIDEDIYLVRAEILAESKKAREDRELKLRQWAWDSSGLSVEFCTCEQGSCCVHCKADQNDE